MDVPAPVIIRTGNEPDDLARFKAEARRWLEANAPLKDSADDFTAGREREFVDGCRQWQGLLHDAGWAGISWPRHHGGLGLSAAYDLAFRRMESSFGVSTAALEVGLGMVAPTIMVHGTDAQRNQHLPALLRGKEVWCQMFSEPGAGSDLAGLSTAARRIDGGWLVDGQKVWTSYARFADFAALLARTDQERSKHRGITFFLLDMTTPGIEIRPIRQMNGAAEFNQVFLEQVKVPDDAVLGEVNDGWSVAATMLSNERGLTGDDWLEADALIEVARRRGLHDDRRARQGIVDIFIGRELLRYLDLRIQENLADGRPTGSLASITNLHLARHLQRCSEVASMLLGPVLVAHTGGDDPAASWAFQLLTAPCVRIASGTDEIQRNILGERVLGLPRDPRPASASEG